MLLAGQLNPRADGGSLMVAANFHFNRARGGRQRKAEMERNQDSIASYGIWRHLLLCHCIATIDDYLEVVRLNLPLMSLSGNIFIISLKSSLFVYNL